MIFHQLLLTKVVAPALALTISFFNFLSDTNILETPSGGCERPVFGKSVVTNTLFAAGDTATGDFNNDGKLDLAFQYGAQANLAIQLGKGNGLFDEPRVIDTNSGSFSLTAADFNNDGKIDLVTPARIFFGDGTGNFPQSRLLLLGTNASGFVAADFNGDDNPDLGGRDFSTGNMEVFFGDGLGGFGNRTVVTFPANSVNSFEITDLNGDGISDISATFSGTNGVGIALGSPTGIQTPVNYPISGTGTAILLTNGDIDGDGDKDIISWGSLFGGGSPFTVQLLNNGNGAFTVQPRVSDGATDLSRISLVDVNSDNKLDLVGSITRGLFVVRLGDNSGTFQESKHIPGLNGQIKLIFEDFTGDGIRDFAINSSLVNSFLVLENNAAGKLGVDQTFVDDFVLYDTASADFNEDGKTDIVTASDSMKLWIALGTGNGLGSASISLPVTGLPRAILTGDLNNDGNQDLLAFLQNGGQTRTAVFYGNGNGTFQPAIEAGSDYRNSGKPLLLNIDGDQFIDLVMPSAGNSNRLSIYQNTAAGTFAFRGAIDVGNTVGSVTAGDYNQDGKIDLAILAFAAHIYLGTGTYTFTPLSIFPAGQANAHIFTTDFNQDGIPDLAATTTQSGASGTPGKVDILLGVGKGGFGAPAEYLVGRGPNSMGAADFDGDGNMDLAIANQGSPTANDTRITFLYGDGHGLFPRVNNAVGATLPRGLVVDDFDSDGKPDIVTSDFSLGLISLARNSCLPPPAVNLPVLSTGADVAVTETDAANTSVNVSVNLNAPATVPVRVRYYTAPLTGVAGWQENDLSEARGAKDYNSLSGELLFQPGETSKTLEITVRGDLVDEFDEKFVFYLINGNNAVIADNQTLITILDNDAPPSLTIGNFGLAEGQTGSNTAFNFPVTLSTLSEKPVFVQFVTGGGTATPNQDYARSQGTLTIPAEQLQGTITVTVNGDLTVEQDETFLVELSDPVNVTISNNRGTGTIINDDNGGTIQFGSATYTTNDSSNGFQFSVLRTGGNGGGVSVRFRTQAGTAIPGQDYTEVTTNLVFADNETSRNVFIPLIIDQLDEPDETVNLIIDNPVGATLGTPSTAVLTIQDLEDQPNLTIADAAVVEGDNGTATMQFFLRLSRPTQRAVSVNFATAADTATAGVDYLSASGTFTIPPGVTRKALNITVLGDFQFEPDETFFLNLSNAVNANLTDNQAIGRITNDEINSLSGTQLVSINRTNNGSGNSDSIEPSISADGKIIAFETFAGNLAENDTNGIKDVYVRNTGTRETKLVSINLAGDNSGNCESGKPFVSGNGRFVAFNSCASTLTGTQLSTTSVYVRDLQTNQTRVVSINTNGDPVNGDVAGISEDGRFIAYQSRDQNITTIPDSQNFLDIFVRDMQTNATQLVTVNSAGNGTGNADSGNQNGLQRNVKITSDGRFVLFPSNAANLVTATANGTVNLFRRDLQNQTTVPVSGNSDNSQLIGANAQGCLSNDGRYAFFVTGVGDLVPNDTNNSLDVFRRDLQNNTIVLVSINAGGTASGNSGSMIPYCSADGRFAAFESTAGDLSSSPDTNGLPDIYWRDISSNVTKLISINNAGTNGGGQFSAVRGIAADGQTVLFMSAAADLLDLPIDNNVNFDLYLRDLTVNKTKVVSVNEGGTAVGNLGTTTGLISANGNVVAFPSPATNLVSIDTNTTGSDIFAFTKNLSFMPIGDFDGDGKTDLSVFRPSDTVWYINNSRDGSFRSTQFGLSQDVPVAADYDGDGKTDVAVFRNGVWYLLFSGNNTFAAISFGQTGDSAVPADYDGDRRSDLAVFSQGVWQIKESSDGNIRTQQFGLSTDAAVPADYDGDRRADLGVFRDGVWYVFQSSDFNVRIEQFGITADQPIQGDYDGDGKTDFAVFRPSTSIWYVHLSQDNSYITTQFGISTDVPLKGDFDGDGKFDIAVFRQGVWYITQSSNQNIRIVQFGIAGDVPIPR